MHFCSYARCCEMFCVLSKLVKMHIFIIFFSFFDFLFVMQYSLFGSILTIGAMVGAIMSGRIADYTGRRGVSIFIAVVLLAIPWCYVSNSSSNCFIFLYFGSVVSANGLFRNILHHRMACNSILKGSLSLSPFHLTISLICSVSVWLQNRLRISSKLSFLYMPC